MDEAFETKQEQFVSYAGSLVDAMTKAKSKLESALRETAQDKLFYEIEMPLSRVLYHMEKESLLCQNCFISMPACGMTPEPQS